jgi:hypothetical protein
MIAPFPRAVVVPCRRDPRDVVLSFRAIPVNAATYQFTSSTASPGT